MARPVRYIFRQGKVHALFTIIKVLSLVIGFSVIVILISLVKDELGYDKFWENGHLLYRGTVDCLGEKLRLNEGWTFYINTVFEDIPQNSHLCFDVLMSRASLVNYMRHFNKQAGQLVDTEDFEYLEPGPYHRGSRWHG